MAIRHLLLAGTAAMAAAVPASTPARRSYLSEMADSFTTYGIPGTFHYSEAVLEEGFEAAIALRGKAEWIDWYRGQVDDKVVQADGSIRKWNATKYSLDDYRIGNNLLWWHARTGDDKYRIAAATIREQINRHPRTPAGGFWHRRPDYPNQMWLDGIYMVDSFYAAWTRRFDAANTTAWDDILLQYDTIDQHTRIPGTALLYHGYDEAKAAVWAHPVTGASPYVWSRAVGWYLMSLVEVIALWPREHAGYDRLVGYFTSLADGLVRAQDAAGGWYLIMNEGFAGREGNYIESSASAMFAYGLLKGIQMGLLDRAKYLAPAQKAYALLADRFVSANANDTINWEGTVSVGSLKGDASYEYYVGVPLQQNDYKGTGPFMLASYEWETWAADA